MECAKQLNFFPPKDSVSTQYSPRMIIHHEPLDYQRHCATPFGTYVQALDDSMIKNDLRPRTLDCIYLQLSPLHQTGYELLDLRTNQVINRGSFMVVPITKNIIELVHALAERENMPTGLKIATQSGYTIYNSTWIVGVDYKQDYKQEQQTNKDNDITEPHDEEYVYTSEKDDEEKEFNYDELEPKEVYKLAEPQQQQDQNEPEQEQDNPIEVKEDEDEDDNNINEDVDEANDDDQVITQEAINQEHQPEITGVRRSTREKRPPVKLQDYHSHFMSQTCADVEEYTQETLQLSVF
ncbi:hypothetical protein ACA910_019741 [Epithemia clementina (nom. ined.)]